jgi:hypothetical protein
MLLLMDLSPAENVNSPLVPIKMESNMGAP